MFLTEPVDDICPGHIGRIILASHQPSTITTEYVVHEVFSLSFIANGCISRPAHQSTSIRKYRVRLKSIGDDQSLECIVLKSQVDANISFQVHLCHPVDLLGQF